MPGVRTRRVRQLARRRGVLRRPRQGVPPQTGPQAAAQASPTGPTPQGLGYLTVVRWGATVALLWGGAGLAVVALGWLRARSRDRQLVSDNLKALGSYTAQLDYMRDLDAELDERTKDVTQ